MRIVFSIFAALLATGCMQTGQSMRTNEPVDTFLLKGDYASAGDCVLQGINTKTGYEARLNVYNTQQYAEVVAAPEPLFVVDIRPTSLPNTSRGEVRENSSVVLLDWGRRIREGIGDCLAE